MRCYICDSNKIKELYKLKSCKVYKCRNCGLRFTLTSKKHSYEEDYFTKEQKPYFDEINKSKIEIFKAWLKEIEKHIKPGKILDVGCATGEFLSIAKKQGWDCYGIDVSKYAVEQARKKFKVNARAGELIGAYEKDFFDVVFMSFIIEHTDNPAEIVKEASKILKKHGIIFISTINEESLLNNVADLIYKLSFGLIKKPVELLHPHQHLTHFSEKDLRKVLVKNGCQKPPITDGWHENATPRVVFDHYQNSTSGSNHSSQTSGILKFKILKLKKFDLPAENFQGGRIKDILLKIFYFFQRILDKGYIIYVLGEKAN